MLSQAIKRTATATATATAAISIRSLSSAAVIPILINRNSSRINQYRCFSTDKSKDPINTTNTTVNNDTITPIDIVTDSTSSTTKNSNKQSINTTDSTATNTNTAATTIPPITPAERPDLKPSELVNELDRYIIGQSDAKRAVAVALRNRWRRHKLSPELRDEVMPKNILMIGPTGCGKTEIARRLAKLTASPFIKVEATKFTEIGFHGKDVDSIIVDLLRATIAATRQKKRREVQIKIKERVENRILDALVGPAGNRADFIDLLRSGALEQQTITLNVPMNIGFSSSSSSSSDDRDSPASKAGRMIEVAFRQAAAGAFSSSSSRSKGSGLGSSGGGGATESRTMTVSESRKLLEDLESEDLLDSDDIIKDSIKSVESDGIVFIDEIDKIASPNDSHKHADASAEGVQRDLLPLIEGTTVSTKHGDIQTDHILFICSGAFHSVKPSDLLAELQGRLPLRVELKALTQDQLYEILTKTHNNLIQQQIALLNVDSVELSFTDPAIREIARIAAEMNLTVENIGARRLNTVIEKIMDDISFNAADQPLGTKMIIDVAQVNEKVGNLLKGTDLGKFML